MDSNRKGVMDTVKKDVRSVLITESGGMLLEDFLKIFRQLTNTGIPYRHLGYQSVEELLLEATDVCRCQRLPNGQLHLRPVCDQSTSHVLKMVERSRKPKSSVAARTAAARRQRCGARVPWLPSLQRQQAPPERPARHGGSVPVEARDSILKLVARHPQGIHLDEFNQKHKALFGHAITYIGLGFFSVKGMLESIPQLVRLKETPTGDKVFPIPAPVCASSGRAGGAAAVGSADHLPPTATTFLSYEDSVRGLSERLLKVLSAQKTGAKVADVLNLYLRQFGHCLDYQEHGFTSLLGALASLGPPFRLEKRADDWHVSVSSGGVSGTLNSAPPPGPQTAGATDGCSTAGDWDAVEDGPPPLAGVPAARPARFRVQRLAWLEGGQQVTTETGYPLLEIVVTHVRSPGEFFFSLSGWAGELSRLEAGLAAVYGSSSAASRRLQPADWQLTVGRPLAARSPAGWRRALLLGRVAENVKVYLVDTGATLLLPIESVQLLHDKFLDVPTLAHEGRLARVAPRHGTWSRAANSRFELLVGGNVALMATVLLQSQYASTVLLCDTRDELDVHVGDQLVAAEHAVIQQVDRPPAPLRTPDCRLLSDVYRLLDGRPQQPRPGRQSEHQSGSGSESESETEAETETGATVPRQSAAQQGRVPPEGAEPLSPSSRPLPETVLRRTSDRDDMIDSLKVQCYDTQKEQRAAPAGPRRAALQAKLRRLEAQLERLLQTGG